MTTNSTPPIPPEVVELAARAGAALLGMSFDDLDETDRSEALAYHESVLAAVSDRIAHRAWNEGYDAHDRNVANRYIESAQIANPYPTTGASE